MHPMKLTLVDLIEKILCYIMGLVLRIQLTVSGYFVSLHTDGRWWSWWGNELWISGVRYERSSKFNLLLNCYNIFKKSNWNGLYHRLLWLNLNKQPHSHLLVVFCIQRCICTAPHLLQFNNRRLWLYGSRRQVVKRSCP